MEKMTTFVFVGNEVSDINQKLISIKKDSYLFLLDKELRGKVQTEERTDILFFDTDNESSFKSLIESLPHLGNLVLLTSISSMQLNVGIMEECKKVLTKLFIITKSFYLLAMHTKDLRIWYLSCSTSNIEEAMVINAIKCLNEGIVAMSMVLGNELTKKKIIVNSIECTKQYDSDKLERFLAHISGKPLYLNLQCIKL